MRLHRHDAGPLSQAPAEREEKNSVTTASNKSFGWGKTFTDPHLCAAVIDRLTFNATILETGTDSLSATAEIRFWIK